MSSESDASKQTLFDVHEDAAKLTDPFACLEPVSDNEFRANCDATHKDGKTIYGGQLSSQAVHCAYQTVAPGFYLHSFHAYYIRAGTSATPVHYKVDRIRDGRTVVTRSVTASQDGKCLTTVICSFQRQSAPSALKIDSPSFPLHIPPPESLKTLEELVKEHQNAGGARRLVRHYTSDVLPLIEVRPANGKEYILGLKDAWQRPLKHLVWIRYGAQRDTSDLRLLHCALIYVGDLLSMGCTMPFPNRPITFYSVSYSAWIHSYAVNPCDWLLFEEECVNHVDGRSFVTGRVWTRSGELIATMTQEALLYAVGEDGQLSSKL